MSVSQFSLSDIYIISAISLVHGKQIKMKLCKMVHIEPLLGPHIGIISLCLCTQTKKEFNHLYQSQILLPDS